MSTMNTFKIRSAKQFATKLTARIQKSGRLGFGANEKELMNLCEGAYVAFASNKENEAATHLIIRRTRDDDAFELKNGNTLYPFVETKQLFDFFSLNYTFMSIFFDLTREEALDSELDGEVYRISVRTKINKIVNDIE